MGCLMHYADKGYHHLSGFYPTADFKNVGKTENSTYYRFGIFGKNDGHFRFAKTKFPFLDDILHEVVISGWANMYSAGRRLRIQDHKLSNVQLEKKSTANLLSTSEPIMMFVHFYNTGDVHFIKEGESQPFFTFKDDNVKHDFIGFSNWDVPVIYFFDCPLERSMDIDVRLAFY